jgi:hypothetical protein
MSREGNYCMELLLQCELCVQFFWFCFIFFYYSSKCVMPLSYFTTCNYVFVSFVHHTTCDVQQDCFTVCVKSINKSENLWIKCCPCGPGSVAGYSDWLRAGGPGIESRWGREIFRTCPDRPWGPPSLLYSGYLAFPGGTERLGRDADPSPLLVPLVMKE